MNKLHISLYILFCVICSTLSTIDNINAIEYLVNANFHSVFLKVISILFILAHPIVLFFYYVISLLYITWIGDNEFNELTSEYEYYEMIYFRNICRNSLPLIIPVSIYLTLLSYCKFFSLYSVKFLIDYSCANYSIFKNIITVTLHYTLIIHCLFQSFPQILVQSINNLLIQEDRHDPYIRGIFGFSTIISLLLISMLGILYKLEKKMILFKKPLTSNEVQELT